MAVRGLIFGYLEYAAMTFSASASINSQPFKSSVSPSLLCVLYSAGVSPDEYSISLFKLSGVMIGLIAA